MAFDAGMLACAVSEIMASAKGGRVEKIFQPERDEIIIQLRTTLGGRRILIDAGPNNPRICYSALPKENPASPPMFCMLLRKHLSGARLTGIEQPNFERMAILSFECRDEMGFECKKYLTAEVMGKYSNLIFTDGDMRVIAALRPVDFTTSSRRQVLPGMKYEAPPPQDKADPTAAGREDFAARYSAAPPGMRADKFITDTYRGVSAALSREIVYRAAGQTDAPLCRIDAGELWRSFEGIIGVLHSREFCPVLVSGGGRMVEYSFVDLTQYGGDFERRRFESAGGLLDAFYGERDRGARIKQRASDVLRIISGAQSRITRKLENQRGELAECARGEEYKRYGDLITSNLYAIGRGDESVLLTDYSRQREDGEYETVLVQLDTRMTPAQNAQRLYKKYAKAKNAKTELTRQIELGESELIYLESVADSLSRAQSAEDLSEIRDELYKSGYASKMKNYTAPKKAAGAASAMKFKTGGGFVVLCGRNNIQNENITHKTAAKNDYWFHVKGRPGSHAVLLCDGREPPEEDLTQAAKIAAHYSSAAGGVSVPVDFTRIKNIKKTTGAKPGFVIYHTNKTAYVTPDAAEVERLRVK